VKARIEVDRLVFVSRFWSHREIPLSSISAVQPGSYGLNVTRIDGTVVSVHAITNFSGRSERAATIAGQIQAFATAVREDRGRRPLLQGRLVPGAPQQHHDDSRDGAQPHEQA
jgi:hypothetical protein